MGKLLGLTQNYEQKIEWDEQMQKCHELAMGLLSDEKEAMRYWLDPLRYRNPKLNELYTGLKGIPKGTPWEIFHRRLLKDSSVVTVDMQGLARFYGQSGWYSDPNVKPEECFGLPFGLGSSVTPEEWCEIKGLDPGLVDFKHFGIPVDYYNNEDDELYLAKKREMMDGVDEMIAPESRVLRRLARASGVVVITYTFSYSRLQGYHYETHHHLVFYPDGVVGKAFTNGGQKIVKNITNPNEILFSVGEISF